MKKLIFVIALSISSGKFYSQGVAINNTATPAGSNAMLDVSSSNKGVFVPRITTAQRKAIAVSVADIGLIVFDRDRNLLYMYDGSRWVPFAIEVNANITFAGSVTSPISKTAKFGYSVAIDSIYAVVGSPYDSIGNLQGTGTAQIFKKQNGNWIQVGELIPSDLQAGQHFGASVCIKGDYITVSAPDYNEGGALDCGEAYIFHRTGNNWVQHLKIKDNAPVVNQHFGKAMAMTDSIIAIGAPGTTVGNNGTQGAVFVYKLTGNGWQYDTRLSANDGAASDYLGTSVSVNGIYIVSGAIKADNTGLGINDCGAVYVFANNRTNWFQQSKTYAGYPAASAGFGNSLSIYNNQFIVADYNNYCELFNKAGSNWVSIAEFSEPAGNNFNSGVGNNLLLHKDYLVIGAPYDQAQGLISAGAIYVYKKNVSGEFVLFKRLTDQEPLTNNQFGRSLDFDGFNLIIGSPTTPGSAGRGKVTFTCVSD